MWKLSRNRSRASVRSNRRAMQRDDESVAAKIPRGSRAGTFQVCMAGASGIGESNESRKQTALAGGRQRAMDLEKNLDHLGKDVKDKADELKDRFKAGEERGRREVVFDETATTEKVESTLKEAGHTT